LFGQLACFKGENRITNLLFYSNLHDNINPSME
jgi:hypothetical protein